MLASAMFYEFVAEHDQNQVSLRLGRLVLNLRQLFIAVQSLLMVIPVNLLIVGIFSLVKSENDMPQQKYRVNTHVSIHTVTQKAQLGKGYKLVLPQCFVYIAWVLFFLSTVVSATLIIFYSLEWGKDISEQWLISIVMSTLMDIFIFEPVKIVIVAFLVSYFCKSDFDEIVDTPSTILNFDDISITAEREKVDNDEENALPEPPSERELRRARAYRMREMRMYRAVRKIVSYLVYLWLLMIICYGGRSHNSFSLTTSLQKTFGELSQVCDVSFIHLVLLLQSSILKNPETIRVSKAIFS